MKKLPALAFLLILLNHGKTGAQSLVSLSGDTVYANYVGNWDAFAHHRFFNSSADTITVGYRLVDSSLSPTGLQCWIETSVGSAYSYLNPFQASEGYLSAMDSGSFHLGAASSTAKPQGWVRYKFWANNDTASSILLTWIFDSTLTNSNHPINEIQITAWPSPVDECLNVKSQTPCYWKVLDTFGRVLIEGYHGQNEFCIPTGRFSNGIYQLLIQDESGRTGKFKFAK